MDNSFADAWKATEVKVTSPNEQVFLTMLGDVDVTVRFAPGYYERATARQLQDQLEKVAALAMDARTRASFELRSKRAGKLVTWRREPVDVAEAEYMKRTAEMFAEGVSSDDSVSMSAIGLDHFTLTFAPGLLSCLDAEAFARRVSEAATGLVQDQRSKVAEIKYDIYERPYLESTERG